MYNGTSPELIKELRKQIVFEEQAFSSVAHEHTLYFIAPKELLNGMYPSAESMEIAIKIPFYVLRINGKRKMRSDFDPTKAIVEFSPTKDGSDYNWYSGDLTIDEINYLLGLYHTWVRKRMLEIGEGFNDWSEYY